MKITLIQPAMGRKDQSFVESWKMEPLSIVALANLTPADHELRFYDDRIESIDYDEATDLVAISTETYTACRSYQIAAAFRARGVPVVMGGYHATLMPEECARYVDAVVIGEAEGVWPTVLTDAQRGQLRKRYQNQVRPSLVGLGQDRSILAGKKYMPLTLVESGRGCKFACNFCSIAAFFNRSYQARPAQEVVREIAASGRKLVFLVDDNIIADFDRAKDLFRALIPLGIRWMGQGTLTAARDPELMRLMRQSGCEGLLIGFESINQANLKAMNKSFNIFPKGRSLAIARLRDQGIKIYATFMFGYEHDSEEIFERTLEFALEQKFFISAFNHLQPFPGTPLYQTLEQEDRLRYPRWWLEPGLRFGDIVFWPRDHSPEDFYDKIMDLRRRYFSVRRILSRATDFKANLASPVSAGFYFWVNAIMRKELGDKFGLPLGDQNEAHPIEIKKRSP